MLTWDTIALLPGWAPLERYVASQIGMTIVTATSIQGECQCAA